ncbi:UTP--glucose-1-phosphate uridylyltransferase GalU [Chitinimonas sp. BJB300]|uniref:UTP--glucose-1-phosphate uridylyltransferase GalU n=1 Tax=Chitinimonas sp. BJB300 TaxID=1559339 RepID=UPI000C10E74C|nr:UTP--glucose-1-phosphate uridylyltransferase GalU [Chitinimonas sp. BJB300]PHV12492.1 UTP--glucose-1-phosphate uridylyltransferase [Chitinimonas sp. BJB300]TSJ89119.1 UTP--glucose-1-phosphate uridylyltransferase GalU [Chitinimonas sp. BJB300]
MQKVTKAVFPVAGLGTRFLPATKASPKEMLNVVDKPLIQYAVEEAVAAGITDMIFVTGRNKRAIEDHFDKAYELETELEAKGKHALLELVRNILPKHVSCAYVRQPEALGLGHAVLCARPLVGDEPFAVILGDDLIAAEKPVMQQMVELYDETHSSVIGVQEVPREDTASYGIVVASRNGGGYLKISGLVEKPKPADAPSTLAVVGRYILSPRIFRHLQTAQPGKGGEIQLTDAIAALLEEERVLALPFEGIRYDCGSKLGYLQATLAFATQHPEVGTDFRAFLRQFCASEGF